MSDLGLFWDNAIGAADVAFTADDFVRDDGLRTAVMISLFTDRQAENADEIPDGGTNRRGWWADPFQSDRIGSRLWLLGRAKRQQLVLDRAAEYVREALQWMLDDRVTDEISVSTEFVGKLLGIAVTIHRPRLDPVTYRFNYAWAAQGAS